MKKKLFTPLTFTYNMIVFGSFFLWGYYVQENGKIDPKEHTSEMTLFSILMVIGVIFAGIGFSGEREKSKKISKKTVYIGVSIAILFVLWRVARNLV